MLLQERYWILWFCFKDSIHGLRERVLKDRDERLLVVIHASLHPGSWRSANSAIFDTAAGAGAGAGPVLVFVANGFFTRRLAHYMNWTQPS